MMIRRTVKWLVVIGAVLLLIIGGYCIKNVLETNNATALITKTLAQNGFPQRDIVFRSATRRDQEFFFAPVICTIDFSTKETIQESRKIWQKKGKTGPLTGSKAPVYYSVWSQKGINDKHAAILLVKVTNGNSPIATELSQ